MLCEVVISLKIWKKMNCALWAYGGLRIDTLSDWTYALVQNYDRLMNYVWSIYVRMDGTLVSVTWTSVLQLQSHPLNLYALMTDSGRSAHVTCQGHASSNLA